MSSSNWADSFQTGGRSSGNPGTWNPGSDGNSWSSQGGLYTLGLTGVSPNVFGTLTGLTTRVTEYYSSASQADGVMSVKFKVSNSSDGCGLVFRGDGTNANQYRCFYRGGNSTLEIAKVVGSTVTTLVSTSFTATANTLYDIKCSFIGNTLQGKLWADGGSEPAYQISTTDATYSNGQFGLQIAAGVNTDTVSVQYFSLSTSVTRVVIALAALLATRTRTLSPTTTALQLTKTRTIPATAALLWTVPGASSSVTMLSTAPLRYYRLDESSGTVAHDLGSQVQNGTLHGTVTLSQPGLINGSSNTAMLFDGSSGYIDLPTTGLPTGAQPWSMAIWVNLPASPGSNVYYPFMALGTDTANNLIGIYYHATHGVQGSSLFSMIDWDDNGVYTSSGFVQFGTRYLLCAVYDGATFSFYVKDSLIGTFAETLNLIYGAAYLGYDGHNFGAGVIDEPAIYDYALTPAQVLTLYVAGSAPYIPATAALQFLAGTRGISATAALLAAASRSISASSAVLATTTRTITATAALSAQRTIPADSALSLADETRAIPASASLALYIALFPQTARRTGLFPTSARRGVSS